MKKLFRRVQRAFGNAPARRAVAGRARRRRYPKSAEAYKRRFSENGSFRLRGACGGGDLTLVTYGVNVNTALDAADILEERGIIREIKAKLHQPDRISIRRSVLLRRQPPSSTGGMCEAGASAKRFREPCAKRRAPAARLLISEAASSPGQRRRTPQLSVSHAGVVRPAVEARLKAYR